MGWRRVLVILPVSAVALVAAGVGSGTGPESGSPLSGSWVGGYDLGSGPVALRVDLFERGSRPAGRAAIGIAAPPIESPLRRVVADGARLALTLANGARLDGQWSGDRIAGTARSTSGRGRFELVRLRPSAASSLQQDLGLYRFRDGKAISLFVEPLGTHLRMLDYESGEMRQLWQVSRDRFIGGPRLLASWPIQVGVELVRNRAGRVVALRRNGQEAQRVPLLVERAQFRDGAVHLVGKLVRPPAGRLPAVVLVAGSEPGTRNSLDLWGMFFASQGFAVLSYDKRGVGKSSGRYVSAPSRANLGNLADDALAAVEWLRSQPEIDAQRIGLSGGSQAGWTIPLAVSSSRHVAFAVIQSGPAMSVGRERAYSALTGAGYVVPPPSEARIRTALAGRPDSGFDPRPALEALRVPALWQLGGVDKRQYTPETLADLAAIAAQGGHQFSVRVYPAGAHSLRETRHGLISEELLASRFVPGLFQDLGAWLRTHVARHG